MKLTSTQVPGTRRNLVVPVVPVVPVSSAPCPAMLVVEDDADIAELIRHYLEQGRPRRRRRRRRASTVMPQLRRTPRRPRRARPDAAGHGRPEVCQALRADPATAAMPIIMLTAKGEEIGPHSSASSSAPTTTSPSRSARRSSWPASRRCCAARTGAPHGDAASLRYGPIDDRRRPTHRRRRRRGRAADRQGVPAAAVPARAPRPRAVARPAADRRLGLPLHRAARARSTSTCAGCARSCRCWPTRSSPSSSSATSSTTPAARVTSRARTLLVVVLACVAGLGLAAWLATSHVRGAAAGTVPPALSRRARAPRPDRRRLGPLCRRGSSALVLTAIVARLLGRRARHPDDGRRYARGDLSRPGPRLRRRRDRDRRARLRRRGAGARTPGRRDVARTGAHG